MGDMEERIEKLEKTVVDMNERLAELHMDSSSRSMEKLTVIRNIKKDLASIEERLDHDDCVPRKKAAGSIEKRLGALERRPTSSKGGITMDDVEKELKVMGREFSEKIAELDKKIRKLQ